MSPCEMVLLIRSPPVPHRVKESPLFSVCYHCLGLSHWLIQIPEKVRKVICQCLVSPILMSFPWFQIFFSGCLSLFIQLSEPSALYWQVILGGCILNCSFLKRSLLVLPTKIYLISKTWILLTTLFSEGPRFSSIRQSRSEYCSVNRHFSLVRPFFLP